MRCNLHGSRAVNAKQETITVFFHSTVVSKAYLCLRFTEKEQGYMNCNLKYVLQIKDTWNWYILNYRDTFWRTPYDFCGVLISFYPNWKLIEQNPIVLPVNISCIHIWNTMMQCLMLQTLFLDTSSSFQLMGHAHKLFPTEIYWGLGFR